jgi:hypothetical protein
VNTGNTVSVVHLIWQGAPRFPSNARCKQQEASIPRPTYFLAIKALPDATAAKQEQLTAGTGPQAHEKLLQHNTTKSLVAGENVTLSSTRNFVSIFAKASS